jgi:hypothetical protein
MSLSYGTYPDETDTDTKYACDVKRPWNFTVPSSCVLYVFEDEDTHDSPTTEKIGEYPRYI